MKKRFVGFGELLVRLAPAGYLRFPQTDSFTVNYTGAEGNMAICRVNHIVGQVIFLLRVSGPQNTKAV